MPTQQEVEGKIAEEVKAALEMFYDGAITIDDLKVKMIMIVDNNIPTELR